MNLEVNKVRHIIRIFQRCEMKYKQMQTGFRLNKVDPFEHVWPGVKSFNTAFIWKPQWHSHFFLKTAALFAKGHPKNIEDNIFKQLWDTFVNAVFLQFIRDLETVHNWLVVYNQLVWALDHGRKASDYASR